MSVSDAVSLILEDPTSLIVFSGSGISSSAGLSTFTAAHSGVYERARKRYKLKSGIDLFHYKFYEEHPAQATSFLARMCEKALGCDPTPTHVALRDLERTGLLLRHYTMNIDGLHAEAGSTLWHTRSSLGKDGKTVELHGSLREVVDVDERVVYRILPKTLSRLKAGKEPDNILDQAPLYHLPPKINEEEDEEDEDDEEESVRASRFRFRVMFYDDREHDCIVDSPSIFALIKKDAPKARIVLWLGVSFEQSASCGYFRRVVAANPDLVHLVVNPSSHEAAFNAKSSLDNPQDTDVRSVQATSDELFAKLLSITPAAFQPPRSLT